MKKYNYLYLLIITLALLPRISFPDTTATCDTTLLDIADIPKLSESYNLVNYRSVFAHGSLLPDKIYCDSFSVATGMTLTRLKRIMPDLEPLEPVPVFRPREQQWGYLAKLLYENYNSMFYYILADIYYGKQLCGYFTTYRWHLDNTGYFDIHLFAPEQDGTYTI